MTFYLLFIIELIIIYLLSLAFGRLFSQAVLRLRSSLSLVINLYTIIFLPGTIIHELSHFLVAAMLGVPVGEIKILPELTEDEVHLGAVTTGKTDVFRRAAIGIAPLVVGTIGIIAIVSFLGSRNFQLPVWQTVIFLYLVFNLSNTMFTSSKDLEGVVEFAIILGILILFALVIIYFLGVQLSFSATAPIFSENVVGLVRSADWFLTIPIALNLITVGGLFLLSKVGRR